MRPCSIPPLMLLPLLLTTAAQAGDGALEINATCAVQTGCFAGDTAGYPVTISQSGSYRLTSNLVQTLASAVVLQVDANDVSIDLGGFEISGPFTCPGNPASCAAAGLGLAIDADLVSGTSVANGSVRGTARGISLGDHCSVRDVRVVETTNHGILAGAGCTLSNIVAARNGSDGVQLAQGSVTGSAAYDNESAGFRFGSNASIANSAARRNGSSGIAGNAGTTVANCTSSNNVGAGISVNAGSVVTASASYNNGSTGITGSTATNVSLSNAYSNGDRGIVLGAGSQAIGNIIRSNVGFGLVLGDGSGYRENVITANSSGSDAQVATSFATDTIFNLGSNVCGTDTICP